MDNNLIDSHKINAEYSYKKKSSYGPFNVYWEEQDLMLFTEYRDGNVPPGKEQLRVFQEAEKQLPSSVSKVYVRVDSAGYQHEFLNDPDSGAARFGKVIFSVSAKGSKSFREAVLSTPEEDWEKVVVKDNDGNLIKTGQEVGRGLFCSRD